MQCLYLFGALKPKPFGLLISGVPCKTYGVPGSYIKVLYSHLLLRLLKLFWTRAFVAVLQKLVVSISRVQCWYLCGPPTAKTVTLRPLFLLQKLVVSISSCAVFESFRSFKAHTLWQLVALALVAFGSDPKTHPCSPFALGRPGVACVGILAHAVTLFLGAPF